ncbi:MAG: winged helix-turn-helix domain-containing protein [Calditrichaeota bacterium]|nr:winged helix-turn-helix domain-containing protein [Calditrichota bacterium]
MIDTATKKAIVQKLLKDELFSSEQFNKLLQYLFTCSIKKTVPSEIEIAQHVFQKKGFDPSEDTLVRVYIYKLRKKLDKYYEGNGKHDQVRLEIPKGHYELSFLEKQKGLQTNIRQLYYRFTKLELVLSFISLILIILLLTSISNTRCLLEKTIDKNDPIWSSFFLNGLANDLVIGDFYIFLEYDEKQKKDRAIIDYEFSTEDEFEKYKNQFPDRRSRKNSMGDLPNNSIYDVKDLMQVFHSFNAKMNLEMSSKYENSKIIDRNIIYVGTFRNLRNLNNLLFNLPIKYKYTHPYKWSGEIFIRDSNSDTLKRLKTVALPEKCYSTNLELVAKLPGPNNENYLIIAGFGYTSHAEIIKMLSRQKSLTELENNIRLINGSVPRYFSIIFEVTSFRDQAFQTEIKYFQEINADYFRTLPM